MTASKAFKCVVLAFVVSVLTVVYIDSAEAQAIIGVSGTSAVLTRIGQTELIGTVTFTVSSGTTNAGTLEFFLPNIVFTNDATTGITLTGSGGLAGATISSVIPSSGIVLINIPAGAAAGSSVKLSGVRITAAGQTFSSLNASISSSGNSIVANQNTVAVVQGVTDGLITTNAGGTTLSVVASAIVSSPGTFVVSEGWANSFSSAVGVNGQTAKTQVIFQVTGLPDNTSVSFASPIFSDTGDGASLITLSGATEVLTNQSPTNRVIYEFNESATSPNILDSFSILPTVAVLSPAVGTGTATIQVALGPIGAAVPTDQFPSTAVPRFAELFLPPLTVTQPSFTTLSIPVPLSIDDQALTLSNTASGGAVIIARARLEDGTPSSVVSNDVTLNLSARQATTVSLKDLFGTNASPSGIAAVDFASVNNGLVMNSIATIGGKRFGVAAPPDQVQTYLPFDLQTSADVPVLTTQNFTDADIPAQITLWSSSGVSIGAASRTVKSHGAVRENFSSLFGSASIPLEGYVTVRGFSGPLRSVLLNNPASRPDEIPSLQGASNSPIIFPFFAFGGGYNSVLTLINASDTVSIRVTLNMYNTTGGLLVSQPFVQSLAPSQRQNLDFNSIFGSVSSSLPTVGYFSLTLDSTITNPFASLPFVFGVLRISTNTLSTVVPLVGSAAAQFYMTPTAETAATYTGFSILNASGNAVSVTVEAVSSTGTSFGSTTFSLAAGSARVQLLRELIPQTVSHDNGTLRISASGNVRVLGFRGTLNLSELIYLRGETTP